MHRLIRSICSISNSIILGVVICIAIAAVPALAQEDPATATIPTVYRDSFTITFSGKSQTAGTFSMTFTPHGEEATKFTVNVIKGMSKKRIAQDTTKELILAAGERYKVKQNGNKVVVKKANKKQPPLNVAIIEQQLSGVSIMIGK